MKIFLMNDYQFPVYACFLLFIAMVLYWISLTIPKNQGIFQLSRILVLVSNALFFLTLASRWFFENYFPLSNLYESLIFLCFGISSIHLYIESKTQSRLIGSLVVPLLFFLSGFSSLTLPTDMQKALPLVPSLQSNWLMMHVSMMMLSYSILIIGSLFSILYLFFETFQNWQSKKPTLTFFKNLEVEQNNQIQNEIQNLSIQKKVINFNQIGLLQTIDIWSYRIIGLGFPFLTIGIISGAVWANEAWGSYWSWDPKETWALITWLIFAIYLHSRLLKGWQGQKAAFLGSCGFFVIWICYLGVNFLGKGLHSYGWIL
jgi:cytochrome c-type biogenesis protein CcsB